MARVSIDEMILKDTADAIRAKGGDDELMSPTAFASAINAIPTTEVTIDKTLTQEDQAAEAKATGDAIAAEAAARAEADTALQQSIAAEIAARTSAVNTEIANRESSDTFLQTQIDQIIAPSGEAPSAAEVENARIDVDGVTHTTLGEAIRGQVEELKGGLTQAVEYFDDLFTAETAVNVTWIQGAIRSASGAWTSAANRCSASAFIPSIYDGFDLVIPEGYKAYVFKYTSAAIAGYVGPLTDGFQAGPTRLHVPTTVSEYIKVTVAYTDDSAITPEDVSGVELYRRPGKYGLLGFRKSLTAADNLDDITAQGWYFIPSSPESRPEGAPTINLGHMLVLARADNPDIKQTAQVLFGGRNNAIYHRFYTSSGWTAWSLIPLVEKTLYANGALSAEVTDLNDFTTMGVYRYASDRVPANAPTQTGGQLVVFSADGVGNSFSRYVTQMFSDPSSFYVRYLSANGWSEWRGIANASLGRYFGDYVDDITSAQIWTQGAINTADGANYPSSYEKHLTRIRSTYYWPVPVSGSRIEMMTEGFKAIVIVYNEQGSYIKASPWIVTGQTFEVDYGTNLRFVVAHDDDSAITPDPVEFAIVLKGDDSDDYAGLPILRLTGDFGSLESKDDKIDVSASIMGTSRTGTIKWQGSSSIRYAKKNYTLNKLAIPNVEGDKTGVDAWDMWREFIISYWRKNGNIAYRDTNKLPHDSTWGVRRKYVLKANYIDPSHARNIVGARLWAQVVQTRDSIVSGLAAAPNYGAVDGFPVILQVNGAAQGLYTMNLSKDESLFAMGFGEKEYIVGSETNGNSAVCWKAPAVCDTSDYEIEYPESDDAAEQELIRQEVAESLNTAITTCVGAHEDWEAQLAPYIDLESVTDYFIFTCCISGTDNIMKNILYGTYDGTKWFMSAYDMDSSFGFDPYGSYLWPVKTARTQFAEASELHRLCHLLYKYSPERLVRRYRALRSGVLSDENVWHEFANFVNYIPENAYRADRKLWTALFGTSMANVSMYMDYYRMHCKYLDDEIDALAQANGIE